MTTDRLGIFLAGGIVGAQVALFIVGEAAARVAIGVVMVTEAAFVWLAWRARR